jgi:hypothetical protein
MIFILVIMTGLAIVGTYALLYSQLIPSTFTPSMYVILHISRFCLRLLEMTSERRLRLLHARSICRTAAVVAIISRYVVLRDAPRLILI